MKDLRGDHVQFICSCMWMGDCVLYGRQFDRYRVPEGKDGGLEENSFHGVRLGIAGGVMAGLSYGLLGIPLMFTVLIGCVFGLEINARFMSRWPNG